MRARFEEPKNLNASEALEEPWSVLQNNKRLNNELEKVVPLHSAWCTSRERALKPVRPIRLYYSDKSVTVM